MLQAMSLFDFFFPEWAEASHLRRLADSAELTERRERFASHRQRHQRLAAKQSQHRIDTLEKELEEATLVIEALIELLEEKDLATRTDLASRVHAIDARDGVVDGRLTPEAKQPFKPNRQWEDQRE